VGRDIIARPRVRTAAASAGQESSRSHDPSSSTRIETRWRGPQCKRLGRGCPGTNPLGRSDTLKHKARTPASKHLAASMHLSRRPTASRRTSRGLCLCDRNHARSPRSP
jgi:hypothetical protein